MTETGMTIPTAVAIMDTDLASPMMVLGGLAIFLTVLKELDTRFMSRPRHNKGRNGGNLRQNNRTPNRFNNNGYQNNGYHNRQNQQTQNRRRREDNNGNSNKPLDFIKMICIFLTTLVVEVLEWVSEPSRVAVFKTALCFVVLNAGQGAIAFVNILRYVWFQWILKASSNRNDSTATAEEQIKCNCVAMNMT